MAAKIDLSSSNIVSIRMPMPGLASRTRRVASMPVTLGMLRSIRTTSGPSSRDRLVILEHREHQDADAGARLEDPPRRLYAGHLGHVEVHQNHVRPQLQRQGHRLLAVLASPTSSIPGSAPSMA